MESFRSTDDFLLLASCDVASRHKLAGWRYLVVRVASRQENRVVPGERFGGVERVLIDAGVNRHQIVRWYQ